MALEYLLDTNEYKKPRVLSGRDALATKLIILLNMKPGTDRLHPEMGVDVIGRYRFCYEEDVDELQEEIDAQIAAYILQEDVNDVDVTVVYIEGELEIAITVDETTYNFKTSDDGVVFSLEAAANNAEEPADDFDDDDDDPAEDDEYVYDNAPVYPGDEGAIDIDEEPE